MPRAPNYTDQREDYEAQKNSSGWKEKENGPKIHAQGEEELGPLVSTL